MLCDFDCSASELVDKPLTDTEADRCRCRLVRLDVRLLHSPYIKTGKIAHDGMHDLSRVATDYYYDHYYDYCYNYFYDHYYDHYYSLKNYDYD